MKPRLFGEINFRRIKLNKFWVMRFITSDKPMAESPDKGDEAMEINDKHIELGSTKCFKCKEELTVDKHAKLLHCLHSFCQTCLEKYSTSKNEPNKDANGEEANNSDAEGTVVS